MTSRPIRLVIPTGRMQASVLDLLDQAGVRVARGDKNYRPPSNDPRIEFKLMKAANIPTLVELGKHDAGFSGLDWVRESSADVETLIDTGLLPVRVVSAAPLGTDPFAEVTDRPLVVASEYERLTRDYMTRRGVEWQFVRTYGASEVFPPEDADLIVDNTATGSALTANRLQIIDELLASSALFVANRSALTDPRVRETLDDLCLLIRGVLAARERVLLEMNVAAGDLERVVGLLPAMKAPTVQPLYGDGEYSVKAAVLVRCVARLLPELRRAGATDILETVIRRVIP